MNTSAGTTRRHRILIAAIVTVAIALLVRIWHDRRAASVATVADLERRVHDHPADEQAQLDWGNALYGQHRFGEAETAFKAAANLNPRDPRPFNWLGLLAVERKQPGDALGYFYLSLKLKPRDAEIWRYTAKLLAQQHDLAAAMQSYEHVTELDPNDTVSWRELGLLEHSESAPARAVEHLQRAATLNPNDAVTQNALGDIALEDGKLPIAKQAFDRSLALHPDDREALLGAARVTLLLDPSPTGLARAGRQIDQVIAALPTARAYLARGQWNLLQRRFNPAVTDLKTALKLDQRLYLAHSFLSQTYAAMGQPQLARGEILAYQTASDASGHPERSNLSKAPGR